jgi:hypothetical protein
MRARGAIDFELIGFGDDELVAISRHRIDHRDRSRGRERELARRRSAQIEDPSLGDPTHRLDYDSIASVRDPAPADLRFELPDQGARVADGRERAKADRTAIAFGGAIDNVVVVGERDGQFAVSAEQW